MISTTTLDKSLEHKLNVQQELNAFNGIPTDLLS